MNGVQRSRSMASSICRARADGGTSSCCSVACAQHAVGREAVTLLERLQRRDECAVETTGQHGAGGQVAHGFEPLREQWQPGVVVAGHQLPVRQRRQSRLPRSVACQCAIARKRLAQAVVHRQHGLRLRQGLCDAMPARRVAKKCTRIDWRVARHVEVGVNTAGIDAPVLQVRQVALQRQGQVVIELQLRRVAPGRPFNREFQTALELRGAVVARIQALRAGGSQHIHGLPCFGGGAAVAKPEQVLGAAGRPCCAREHQQQTLDS